MSEIPSVVWVAGSALVMTLCALVFHFLGFTRYPRLPYRRRRDD